MFFAFFFLGSPAGSPVYDNCHSLSPILRSCLTSFGIKNLLIFDVIWDNYFFI